MSYMTLFKYENRWCYKKIYFPCVKNKKNPE